MSERSEARRKGRLARGLVRVTMWLPAVLVAELDALVGRRGRSKWVREAMTKETNK